MDIRPVNSYFSFSHNGKSCSNVSNMTLHTVPRNAYVPPCANLPMPPLKGRTNFTLSNPVESNSMNFWFWPLTIQFTIVTFEFYLFHFSCFIFRKSVAVAPCTHRFVNSQLFFQFRMLLASYSVSPGNIFDFSLCVDLKPDRTMNVFLWRFIVLFWRALYELLHRFFVHRINANANSAKKFHGIRIDETFLQNLLTVVLHKQIYAMVPISSILYWRWTHRTTRCVYIVHHCCWILYKIPRCPWM